MKKNIKIYFVRAKMYASQKYVNDMYSKIMPHVLKEKSNLQNTITKTLNISVGSANKTVIFKLIETKNTMFIT